MKDLYTEHYKILLKETEENTTKWKASGAHRLEDLMLVKCSDYQKWSVNSVQSLKIPVTFFAEVDKEILKTESHRTFGS